MRQFLRINKSNIAFLLEINESWNLVSLLELLNDPFMLQHEAIFESYIENSLGRFFCINYTFFQLLNATILRNKQMIWYFTTWIGIFLFSSNSTIHSCITVWNNFWELYREEFFFNYKMRQFLDTNKSNIAFLLEKEFNGSRVPSAISSAVYLSLWLYWENGAIKAI